jgi:glycosyltransferase involved in cell wall biosynthesis
MPPRRHHIHYSLFPIGDGDIPLGVDRYVSISDFTAEGVRKRYHRNAETIYPFVEPPNLTQVVKERLILTVGRPDKAIETMVGVFHEMDIDARLAVVINDASIMRDSLERVIKFSGKCDLYESISREELSDLYSRAAVLWAARGFDAGSLPPEKGAEHFGYTPVEALHHFCVPIAYDGGGYTETTLLRWDDTIKLKKLTETVFGDRETWNECLTENRDLLGRFSRHRFKMNWWRIISSTNAFAWLPQVEWRVADDPQIAVESVDRHVAVIGDHPARASAYGMVADQLSQGLIDAGYKVHVFGINDWSPTHHRDYASLWPSPPVVSMDETLKRFIRSREFDAALVIYDPFVADRLLNGIRGLRWHLPTAAYVTQDGLPPHIAWQGVVTKSDIAVTYCKTAADVISRDFGRNVEWVYPGVDHANFRRFADDDRAAIRSMLDFNDKFVIFSVCRNTRNKRVAGMIKVVSILRDEYDYDDIALLLHTDVIPDQQFHGIDIRMYTQLLGLNAEGEDFDVTVCPKPPDLGGSLPYDVDVDEVLRETPRRSHEKHEWFRRLGMIGRYNVADLYLDMSSAEGFGLTTFEAIGCGLPVISVDDDFVRSELLPGACHLIEPSDVMDEWVTGANLKLVDPHKVAHAIHLYREGELDTGKQVSRDRLLSKLTWDAARKEMVQIVQRCLEM